MGRLASRPPVVVSGCDDSSLRRCIPCGCRLNVEMLSRRAGACLSLCGPACAPAGDYTLSWCQTQPRRAPPSTVARSEPASQPAIQPASQPVSTTHLLFRAHILILIRVFAHPSIPSYHCLPIHTSSPRYVGLQYHVVQWVKLALHPGHDKPRALSPGRERTYSRRGSIPRRVQLAVP